MTGVARGNRWWWSVLVALALAAGLQAVGPPCAGCVLTRVWEVPPRDWQHQGRPTFPEQERLDRLRPSEIGVAFSGGGTRSAAATLGQLRGLQRNGWLDRIRYVAAVSGGSWAAVPFTYTTLPLEEFLGAPTAPRDLTPELARGAASGGRLGELIVDSDLGHVGLQELPQFLPELVGSALENVRGLLRRVRDRTLPDPDRRDKTYAHMLGQKFVAPVVPDGNRRVYTWDDETAVEMVTGNPGLRASDFLRAAPDRPFLIVGGTLVLSNAYYAYPRLVPVEYTPLYTGIRQRFGARVGGAYVWPWAYDRLTTERAGDGRIRVGPGPDERMFTLADVVASSGAAPQLALILGDGVPARVRDLAAQAAEVFPAFTPLAVRDGSPAFGTTALPHGDGGFTDNLGLMPLLARQVHNLIIFVNSNVPFDRNDQLESYFRAFDQRMGSGDRSMNAVFDEDQYAQLLAGLRDRAARGEAQVYCGRNWSVDANELYNIRSFGGLNVCWVYNDDAARWHEALAPAVQAWFEETPPQSDEAGRLAHFPHYATFGENKARVIQLTAEQVNLLANLSYWAITNEVSVREIVDALGGSLPEPPPDQPQP